MIQADIASQRLCSYGNCRLESIPAARAPFEGDTVVARKDKARKIDGTRRTQVAGRRCASTRSASNDPQVRKRYQPGSKKSRARFSSHSNSRPRPAVTFHFNGDGQSDFSKSGHRICIRNCVKIDR